MNVIAGIVKSVLVPGSVSLLILGLLVGVGLLYGPDRARRWGRLWLTALALVYWFFSTPATSAWFAAPLSRGYAQIVTAADAAGSGAIVVLAVGNAVYRAGDHVVEELGKASAMNVIETARLYRLLGSPWVVASGGVADAEMQIRPDSELLRDALVKLGVDRDRILLESTSRTTREQAVMVAALLAPRGVTRFVLVTASDHMGRAVGAFEGQGLEPIPSVSALLSEDKDHRTRPGWIPGRYALETSEWAAYEYLARAYYRSRGWFAGALSLHLPPRGR